MKGTVWGLIESIGVQLMAFVLFSVLASLLKPEDIGVAQMALTVSGLAFVLAEQGYTSKLVQVPNVSERLQNSAFWLVMATGAVLGLGMAVTAPWIAALYNTPALAPVLQVLAISVPLSTVTLVQQATLVREMRFRSEALRKLTATLLGGAVGVVLALQGWGLWSLVAKAVVQAATECVVLWGTSAWRPKLQVGEAELKELAVFGTQATSTSLLAYANQRANDFIVGFMLGPAALGYYAVSFRAINTLQQLTNKAFSRSALPLLARLHAEPVRRSHVLSEWIELVTIVTTPLFLGLGVLSPQLVAAVLGEQWLSAVPSMRLLGLLGPMAGLNIFLAPSLLATNKASTLLRFQSATSLLNVIVTVSVASWGIEAVIIGFIARGWAQVPAVMWLLRRELGVPLFPLCRSLARALLAGGAMVIAVQCSAAVLGNLQAATQFFLLVPIGAAVYVAVVCLVAPSLVKRLLALLVKGFGTRGQTSNSAI